MTTFAHGSSRRDLLEWGLAAFGVLGWPPFAPAAFAAGRKKAYIASGKGAGSLLDDPDYRRVFLSIFSDLDTTLVNAPSHADMLAGMLAADVVYLSVHSNSRVIGVAKDDYIHVGDLHRQRRLGGHGPRLVVVAGCLTLDTDTRVTIPHAFGMLEESTGLAYIGFDKTIVGVNVDAFFRVFFALWLRPNKDGTYRTLAEARDEAVTFIENRIVDNEKIKAAGNTDAGKMMQFAAGVPFVGRSMEIVGDAALRYPDLDRPLTGKLAAPDPTAGSNAGTATPSATTTTTPQGNTPKPPPPDTGRTGAGAAPSGGSSWTPSSGGWGPAGGSPGPAPSKPSGGGNVDAINDMLKR